jgi:hypothetical protein
MASLDYEAVEIARGHTIESRDVKTPGNVKSRERSQMKLVEEWVLLGFIGLTRHAV